MRSDKEIYAQAKREASNLMTQEQIALNAMFMLRKEFLKVVNNEPDEDEEDGEEITVSVSQSDINFFAKNK